MDRRHFLLTVAAAALGSGLATSSQALSPTSDSKAAGRDTYLAMPPATGVIPRRDGRRSTLTVEMGLDIADRDLRARAGLSKPRLTSAYHEVVRATARTLLPGRVPDIDTLGAELQAATDRVLGHPGARLLLGSVIVI